MVCERQEHKEAEAQRNEAGFSDAGREVVAVLVDTELHKAGGNSASPVLLQPDSTSLLSLTDLLLLPNRPFQDDMLFAISQPPFLGRNSKAMKRLMLLLYRRGRIALHWLMSTNGAFGV